MTILKRLLLGSAMYVPFSRIKTCLYKRSGAEIGRNVHMAPGVAILCEDMRRVDIGDECSIGLNVRIRCGAFALGEHTKIASGACVDGASAVTIGRQVYIGHKALLDCWDNIVIEDRVQVSPGAFILTHDSSRHYISGEAVRSGPTVLREFLCRGGRHRIAGGRGRPLRNYWRRRCCYEKRPRQRYGCGESRYCPDAAFGKALGLNAIHGDQFMSMFAARSTASHPGVRRAIRRPPGEGNDL